jgi:uncharacterized membrane protein YgcG
MSDHMRIDLDDAVNESRRQPIDANWSPRKKAGVGVCAAIVAAAAIGGGAWAYMNNRTPSLPRTMDQALAVMQSGKLDSMDPQRRAQYTAEARRILWALSDEDRRKLFEDEANRDAMRAIREQTFDEVAYKRARGEETDWSQFGPRRDEMTEEQRKRMEEMRERWENMTPEEREAERAKRMEEMRAEMVNRINEQFGSGNSQSGALRGEMMGGGRGGPRGGMGGGRPGGGGGRGG